MKITIGFLTAILITGFGCHSQADKTEAAVTTDSMEVSSKPENEIMTGIEGCYMQVLSRDTFAAFLQQNGNRITGKLSFDNYEKDGSSGTVKGEREDNVIKLLYSFASEGTNSVMEVYYKYNNGQLLRGTGDMVTRGDTVYFKDASSIQYNGGILTKLPCTSLPHKYK